jgi:hypothetical protein
MMWKQAAVIGGISRLYIELERPYKNMAFYIAKC